MKEQIPDAIIGGLMSVLDLPSPNYRNPDADAQLARQQRAAADDDMRLPDGKVCGNCHHFKRCKMLFRCSPDNVTCDFAPSRFHLAEDERTEVLRQMKQAGGVKWVSESPSFILNYRQAIDELVEEGLLSRPDHARTIILTEQGLEAFNCAAHD